MPLPLPAVPGSRIVHDLTGDELVAIATSGSLDNQTTTRDIANLAGGASNAILVESGPSAKISAFPPASHPLSVLDTSEGVPGIQKDGDDDLVNTFLSRFNLLGAPLTNSTATVVQNDGSGTTSLLGLEYCYIVAGSNTGDQILQLADISSNYVPSINPSGAEYTIVMHAQNDDSVQILAGVDDSIVWGAHDGDQGGSLTTTTNGSSVTLVADGSAHTWYVKAWEGTWTQTNGGSPVTFTSPSAGGGGSLTLTDGTHTVASVGQITVTGGTVGGTSPNATLAISGGGNTLVLTAATNIAAGTSVSVNSAGHAQQTWGPAAVVNGLVALSPPGVTFAIASPILMMGTSAFITFAGLGIGATASTISGNTITPGALNTNALLQLVQPTQAAESINGGLPTAASFSSTSFLAVASSGSDTVAFAGSLTGTTIAVGSPVTLDSGNALYANIVSIAALSSTLAVAAYVDLADNTYVVALLVSGTTITAGAPVLVPTSAQPNWPGGLSVVSLTATSFAVLWCDSTAQFLTAAVGTVLTLAITLNSPVASTDLGAWFSAARLSATQIAVSGQLITATSNAVAGGLELLTISGTTPSFGSPVAVPGGTIVATLDATHVVAAPWNNSQAGAFQSQPMTFAPSVFTLSGGAFSGSNAPSEYTAFGAVIPLSSTAWIYTGMTGGSLASDTAFTSVGIKLSIFEGDNNGNISPGVDHFGYCGYWLYPISSSKVLASLLDPTGALFGRIINIEPFTLGGPIGTSASAVTSGNSVTITLSGACTGFTGLSPGQQYYSNGDGSITTANIGHPIGVAKDSATLIVNPR